MDLWLRCAVSRSSTGVWDSCRRSCPGFAPFLAPGYAWLAKAKPGAVMKVPDAVSFCNAFIRDKLMARASGFVVSCSDAMPSAPNRKLSWAAGCA